MTREKKEIIKKIENLYREIEIDSQLAFGCVPPGAYDNYYKTIDELEDKPAHLRHFKNAQEMYDDYFKRQPNIEF